MRLEEALPALRAGKTIRCPSGATAGITIKECTYASFLELAHGAHGNELEAADWEIVDEPATDEELAEAFEAYAVRIRDRAAGQAELLMMCADMIRNRYVEPNWKTEKTRG